MPGAVQDLWPLLPSLIGGFLALRVFGVLSPCIAMDMTVSHLDSEIVILRIEVRNISRITVYKTRVLLAINWHAELSSNNSTLEENCFLSEWVDFSAAEEILVSTNTLSAGEIITVERAYRINNHAALQSGIQFVSELTGFQRLVRLIWPRTWRWTTTRIHILQGDPPVEFRPTITRQQPAISNNLKGQSRKAIANRKRPNFLSVNDKQQPVARTSLKPF
jgi:hypothetical protein